MSIDYSGMYKKLKNGKGKRTLNSSITVRVDNTTKKEFEDICNKMGMTVSQAVNAFVEKVINLKALPFSINGYKRKRKLFIAEGEFKDISEEDWKQMDEEIIEMFESSDKGNEYFN